MKELDQDSAAKTPAAKTGSDEDAILVEGGGPAVNDKGSMKKKKGNPLVSTDPPADTAKLLHDLRALIDAGRTHVAQAVNAGLVLLYWGIGERIHRRTKSQEGPF